MPEEFPTLKKNVSILSSGYNNTYFVQALDKKRNCLADGEYPHQEYAALIRQIWESVLQGKRPKLIGYELANQFFALETIHFLSPANLGERPLASYRADLLFWLRENVSQIISKAPDIPGFGIALESIIEKDIQAKKYMAEDSALSRQTGYSQY